MNRLLAGFGIVALVFAPVGLAMACSSHGANGGAKLKSWMSNHVKGSLNNMGTDGFKDDDGNVVNTGARGNQENRGRGKPGWAANDRYWVDVTMPDGSVVTVSTMASQRSSGANVEAWLVDEGKKAIANWFNDFEPADVKLKDYWG